MKKFRLLASKATIGSYDGSTPLRTYVNAALYFNHEAKLGATIIKIPLKLDDDQSSVDASNLSDVVHGKGYKLTSSEDSDGIEIRTFTKHAKNI